MFLASTCSARRRRVAHAYAQVQSLRALGYKGFSSFAQCSSAPEHSYLKDIGRVDYVAVSDREALDAFRLLSSQEGIIPALESSHAVAAALRIAPDLERGSNVLVNLSGRGDKDLTTVAALNEKSLEDSGVAN